MPLREGVTRSGRANSGIVLQTRKPRLAVASAGELLYLQPQLLSGGRGRGPTFTHTDTLGPQLPTPLANKTSNCSQTETLCSRLPAPAQRPPDACPWRQPAQVGGPGEVRDTKPSAPGFTAPPPTPRRSSAPGPDTAFLWEALSAAHGGPPTLQTLVEERGPPRGAGVTLSNARPLPFYRMGNRGSEGWKARPESLCVRAKPGFQH